MGVSWRKNAQTYCGPTAFSEKESSAMAKFVRSHGQSLEYYLAFHSYGQYMIVPYADRKEHMDNYDELVSTTFYNFVIVVIAGARTKWT